MGFSRAVFFLFFITGFSFALLVPGTDGADAQTEAGGSLLASLVYDESADFLHNPSAAGSDYFNAVGVSLSFPAHRSGVFDNSLSVSFILSRFLNFGAAYRVLRSYSNLTTADTNKIRCVTVVLSGHNNPPVLQGRRLRRQINRLKTNDLLTARISDLQKSQRKAVRVPFRAGVQGTLIQKENPYLETFTTEAIGITGSVSLLGSRGRLALLAENLTISLTNGFKLPKALAGGAVFYADKGPHRFYFGAGFRYQEEPYPYIMDVTFRGLFRFFNTVAARSGWTVKHPFHSFGYSLRYFLVKQKYFNIAAGLTLDVGSLKKKLRIAYTLLYGNADIYGGLIHYWSLNSFFK